MPLVTRDSAQSFDTSTAMFAGQIAGLVAGETIEAPCPCYVGADGKVYMSDGTADDANARVHGWALIRAKRGQGCTLVGPGTRMRYTNGGLTPGVTKLYLGAAKGRIDTAATVGGKVPIALAITTTDIVVTNYVL